VAWVVLQPLLSMSVFTLFCWAFWRSCRSDGFAVSVVLFSGAGAVDYFRDALSFSNECGGGEPACHHASVLFPRLILPLASVLSGLVDFAIAFLALVVMVVEYGLRPGAQVLWLPFLLLLAVGTALAVGCGFPRSTHRYSAT
jgi:lipopolysaccharide transport system permease protein